jgi:hypothetical protein
MIVKLVSLIQLAESNGKHQQPNPIRNKDMDENIQGRLSKIISSSNALPQGPFLSLYGMSYAHY